MGPKLGSKMKPHMSQPAFEWNPKWGAKGLPKAGQKGAPNWRRVGLIGVPSGLARNSDSGQGLVEMVGLRYQFVLGQPCVRSFANWTKVMPRAALETYRARCSYEAVSDLFIFITYIRINTM